MKKAIDSEIIPLMKRYLGVDYGSVHVGLAIADEETKIAFTYGSLQNDQKFLEKFREILHLEGISVVIIGVPMHVNRDEKDYVGKKFGEHLRQTEQLEVIYHDEMFSTLMAKNNLRQKGAKKVKELDHQEAARIILQSWMEKAG